MRHQTRKTFFRQANVSNKLRSTIYRKRAIKNYAIILISRKLNSIFKELFFYRLTITLSPEIIFLILSQLFNHFPVTRVSKQLMFLSKTFFLFVFFSLSSCTETSSPDHLKGLILRYSNVWYAVVTTNSSLNTTSTMDCTIKYAL